MRIAIGGIATESCTFSPVLTRLEDFTIVRGDKLIDDHSFLAGRDVELVPTIRARALPGGPVEAGAYCRIKQEFMDLLRAAGRLDGLFLQMHGAMNVVGMNDAEGDWIRAAREVVRNDCLISASYDLHGNVSARVIDHLDMLTAYRTAPHVDVQATKEKACQMLIHCLREGIRPQKAWIPIPVALSGERTSTETEPAAGLYASLAQVDSVPGVLDASILVGYVWADEPRTRAGVVVTGTDRTVIGREANTLARRYWDARHAFVFRTEAGSMDQCIDWALEVSGSGIFISDSGDNPTAGGAGDMPVFLERLLAHRVGDAVLGGIVDAETTDACYAWGLGSDVEMCIGAKLDPSRSKPLKVRGRVIYLDSVDLSQERQAVIQVAGVTVIVTQRRRPFHHVEDFTRLGIDPRSRKMIVVKMGYLVPQLKPIAGAHFLALSSGAVDQAIERLPYRRIERPIFPLDKNLAWEP